jgi:hypothetical protein
LKPAWQIVLQILSRKHPTQKRDGGVAQGVGPVFKPQYCKKEKKRKEGRDGGREEARKEGKERKLCI